MSKVHLTSSPKNNRLRENFHQVLRNWMRSLHWNRDPMAIPRLVNPRHLSKGPKSSRLNKATGDLERRLTSSISSKLDGLEFRESIFVRGASPINQDTSYLRVTVTAFRTHLEVDAKLCNTAGEPHDLKIRVELAKKPRWIAQDRYWDLVASKKLVS